MSLNSAIDLDGFPSNPRKEKQRDSGKPLQIILQSFYANRKLLKKLNQDKYPFYKVSSRPDVKNYKPVSLTSHVSKFMECIVMRKLMTFLDYNDLLSDTQLDFRLGRIFLT